MTKLLSSTRRKRVPFLVLPSSWAHFLSPSRPSSIWKLACAPKLARAQASLAESTDSTFHPNHPWHYLLQFREKAGCGCSVSGNFAELNFTSRLQLADMVCGQQGFGGQQSLMRKPFHASQAQVTLHPFVLYPFCFSSDRASLLFC